MKNTLFISFLFFAILFLSCSDQEELVTPAAQNAETRNMDTEEGTWFIKNGLGINCLTGSCDYSNELSASPIILQNLTLPAIGYDNRSLDFFAIFENGDVYSSHHNDESFISPSGMCATYGISDNRRLLYAKVTKKKDTDDSPLPELSQCSEYAVANGNADEYLPLTFGVSEGSAVFSNEINACRDLSIYFHDLTPNKNYRIIMDKVIVNDETIQTSGLYSSSTIFNGNDIFVFNGSANSEFMDGVIEFEFNETSGVVVNICITSTVSEYSSQLALLQLESYNNTTGQWQLEHSYTNRISNSHD